ncbi:hypothetical protein RND71_003564 [Anisodus tanguticus]|uniref:Uncharacterized protein n=1 Tax=Anisodus tanguticus TaxID=243964 RepID=A0AAE1SX10_9SOLA|nr:hypothetical protein RND71_003564 [Anisodus tanguticus]
MMKKRASALFISLLSLLAFVKEADKISALPGQPQVNFAQFSGYVTIDPLTGRALFYYFAESDDPLNKPLVLWINGVANILFLESPVGVGFSYSNTTSNHVIRDTEVALNTYAFLVNLVGKLILNNNKITNQTMINIAGIAIGNPNIDYETRLTGFFDYIWTHALISDEIYKGIVTNCNFSAEATTTKECQSFIDKAREDRGNIDFFDLSAPLCTSSSFFAIDTNFPCADDDVLVYLNTPQVQESLHANVTGSIEGTWQFCK